MSNPNGSQSEVIDVNDRRTRCMFCGVVLYVHGTQAPFSMCIFCAPPSYEEWRAERIRKLSE